MKYRMFEDPGHGWLEVPAWELQQLDITDQITSYSYISNDGTLVYLEEDCDLTTFAQAKNWNLGTIDKYLSEHVHKENIFIRNLRNYAPGLLAPRQQAN